jgi:anti-sigma regulatory factor (Ser/Thr protein kinase)/putative methionine-R-sulfoxide reductase with GAF domain
MSTDQEHDDTRRERLGAGQVVLDAPTADVAPAEQIKNLYRLSDPQLSELGVNELLDELLVRVREALDVDTVAILLFDPDTNELVARAARGIEEEVEQGVRIPIGVGFAGRIAAERVPIFIADVDHADILNPILREKGIRSLLGVPLIVEGELIGVLHVGALTPRTFDQRDVAVLQLAAVRAAPGIERAQVYAALEREHRVAVVLQRSLLPQTPAHTIGISVAARYLPARNEVGGDWYDVIELPRGRVGVAIGDVVGHGIAAAAMMGQLRAALHAYAAEGHEPGDALELVDRYAHTLGDRAMATVAYAVLDPESGMLSFASAGHLPPIVIGVGEPRVLDAPAGAPLAAAPYGRYPECEVELAPGEMVMLYTDGLVERRGEPLVTSIDKLVTLVRDAPSAEDVCLRAVDGMVPPEGPADDVAVVTLRHIEVPLELHLRLPADPDVLSRVRRLFRRWLRDRGASTNQIEEVTLAVNEACANAIEHAYSPAPAAFELGATAGADGVTITVRDSGQWRPPRGQDRGRGLKIIETAMDMVDVHPSSSGTEVVMRRRLVDEAR